MSFSALQANQLKHGASIVGDLTKEGDMKHAVHEAIDKLGGLDIIINRQALHLLCDLTASVIFLGICLSVS